MINTINFNIQRKCPNCGKFTKLTRDDFLHILLKIKPSNGLVKNCECGTQIFMTKHDIRNVDCIEDTNPTLINWVESMFKKDLLSKKLISYPKREKCKFYGHHDFEDIYEFLDNLILLIENSCNHNYYDKTNIPDTDNLDNSGHVINHKDFYLDKISETNDYFQYKANIRIHEISGKDNRFISRFKACYNFINEPSFKDTDQQCHEYDTINCLGDNDIIIKDRVSELDEANKFISRHLDNYTGFREIDDRYITPRGNNSKYKFLYMYAGTIKETPSYGGTRDAKVINVVFEMKIDKDTGRARNYYKGGCANW